MITLLPKDKDKTEKIMMINFPKKCRKLQLKKDISMNKENLGQSKKV
jgi:hypothetical protein